MREIQYYPYPGPSTAAVFLIPSIHMNGGYRTIMTPVWVAGHEQGVVCCFQQATSKEDNQGVSTFGSFRKKPPETLHTHETSETSMTTSILLGRSSVRGIGASSLRL